MRSPDGNIQALLTRRDEAEGGNRYCYLSSARHGRTWPGFAGPLPTWHQGPCRDRPSHRGSAKADVALALSGLPTVGAAGLAWRPALNVLTALGCKTVRLAFDADALDNPNVARAVAACREAIDAAGLAVELERWDIADGKGIDDLLAAGKTPEVLTGNRAVAAIAEALAAATAGEPLPPPDELERLQEVVTAGGAGALFSDRPLLQALARLANADPAAFAAHRAVLKGLVSLRDLDAALKPFRREQARERPPVLLATAGYRVSSGCIVRERLTPDGQMVEVPLCNFTARIVEEAVHDDGAEQSSVLTVEGKLSDGTELPRAEVPAEEFASLSWPVTAWGTRPWSLPARARKTTFAAPAPLSGNVPRRVVYEHLGWRKIGERWAYLHAGGAIGAEGMDGCVEVVPPTALALFSLPEPPSW